MPETLSDKALLVQNALSQLGLECKVVELPDSTRTAQEAAETIGTTVPQIVKTLVFRAKTSGNAVIVLASGSNRVNEKMIGALLGEKIEKADADFVRAQTGYAIGGVAPLGYPQPLTTYIDQDLLHFDEVWAAAGTPHAVFRLEPKDLERMTGGSIVQVC